MADIVGTNVFLLIQSRYWTRSLCVAITTRPSLRGLWTHCLSCFSSQTQDQLLAYFHLLLYAAIILTWISIKTADENKKNQFSGFFDRLATKSNGSKKYSRQMEFRIFFGKRNKIGISSDVIGSFDPSFSKFLDKKVASTKTNSTLI